MLVLLASSQSRSGLAVPCEFTQRRRRHTCNQRWHLSCAGLRYNRNLSAGWTCQLCSTTPSQPPSALQPVPPPHQPVAPISSATSLQPTPSSTSAIPSFGPSHAPSSTFRILQLNLSGLRSRQVELLKFLQDEQIDVACVQETNLGGGVEPPRLNGWQLVDRKDRRVNRDGQPTRTHHGGIAFFVREGVHYEDKPDVATSAVASNDNTTECSICKTGHHPQCLCSFDPSCRRSGPVLRSQFSPNNMRHLRLQRLQCPQPYLGSKLPGGSLR